ncbi:MAG: pilus assembly protein CpaB [Thermoleophilia bacterium]|nr:pilus assembly protein CpaB [Thermoleophilia bacterium]
MNYTVRNLLIAAALMLVGIVAVTSFIRGERQSLSRGKQEVTVLVATKDIPPGTAKADLEAGGYLDETQVLREDAPPNAIGSVSDISKSDVVDTQIFSGEVLSLNAFDKTAGLSPTAQIKGNQRLFAVPVPAPSDAAGLVRPGDHIDIVAALKSKDSDTTITSVIARDIEVIETPQSLQPKGAETTTEAPDAEGATKLYVLKATDREMANIKFALANADDYGLMMSLRPANGDTETKITPIYGAVEEPKVGVATQLGPDPTVQ